jgi:hypothetical protein
LLCHNDHREGKPRIQARFYDDSSASATASDILAQRFDVAAEDRAGKITEGVAEPGLTDKAFSRVRCDPAALLIEFPEDFGDVFLKLLGGSDQRGVAASPGVLKGLVERIETGELLPAVMGRAGGVVVGQVVLRVQ